jgi:TolB-like protein/Flp pilus assembly protein TadD
VIDDTREPDALVPDRFRKVQWTRLPGGAVPPDVKARFLKLWSHRAGVLNHQAERSPGVESRPEPPARSRTGLYALMAAVLAAAAVAGWLALKPETKPAAAAVGPEAPTRLSEAGRLTAQARALIDDDLMAGRENFRLADEFCRRAVALDGADGEAWATAARVSGLILQSRYEMTPERKEMAKSQVERAHRLAPDSIETGLASAVYLGVSREFPEAEQLLRKLIARVPTDRRLWHHLASIYLANDRLEDALALFAEGSAYLAGDPRAESIRATVLVRMGRYREADGVIDQVLARSPTKEAYTRRVTILGFYRCDMPAAGKFLGQIPPQLLKEDGLINLAAEIWLRLGDGEKALKVLEKAPRDFLEEGFEVRPKGFVVGYALQVSGRPTAAQAEWRQALVVMEKRLAGNPNQPLLLFWQGMLQALTGQKAQALETRKLYRELEAKPDPWFDAMLLVAAGENEQAIRGLLEGWPKANFNLRSDIRGDLMYAPWLAAIRPDPRIQALIVEHTAAIERDRAGPVASAPVDHKSVAVLAFANLSSDKEQEFFSDGISEELLNVLAKVPGLKVTARTSSFHFKGKDTPIPEIARQLGVAYVVEGSVRKAGDKVRITAQLIKAADGFHVWSDTFTRDLEDIFAVQDEIAGLIAQNLSLKFGTSSVRKVAPVNPQAFELYVQARQAWSLRTPEGFARAEQMLNRAMELAPDFVRARAALIDVVQMRRLRERKVGAFGQRHFPEIAHRLEQVRGVLAIDPDLAEAYSTLGQTLDSQWQREEAGRAYRRATELNPNYATGRHWYGMHLAELGRMDEALAELKAACDIDPFSFIILDNYGWLLNLAGRNREAVQMLDRAAALNPGFDQTARAKATALAALGRTAEAQAIARQLRNFQRELDVWTLVLVGLHDEARTLLDRMEPRDVTNRFQALLAAGQREAALAALADPSGASKGDSIDTLFQPIYDPVRTDPRFIEYLSTLGLAEAHTRAQAWRKAHPPEKPESGKQ